jgi:3'-5' exoribonuclease
MQQEKTQFINEVTAGVEVRDLFLVTSAQRLQTKTGQPYWRIELKDHSGAMEAKVWAPVSETFEALPPGSIVEVLGKAGLYRERLEITIERLRILSDEELSSLELNLFLEGSARRPEDLLAELINLCKRTFVHKPWRRCVVSFLENDEVGRRLLVAPAAKGVHHAYAGGLLEHTLSVASLCLLLADHYPELDRQILLAGAVCHDLGKAWELSGGLAPDYTDEGRLVGHISMILEIMDPYIRKSGLESHLVMHFRHLILSHHGELAFGSPKVPQTAEAIALHYADNLDAKLAQCREVLREIPSGETGWSAYQKTLERFLYQAVPTPGVQKKTATAATQREAAKDDQCSLLLKA